MNIWDLPGPDDLPNNDYIQEYYSDYPHGYGEPKGGMDPEKGDKDNTVTPEELENIEKFLESINPSINPPND